MKQYTKSEKLARILSTLFVPPSFTIIIFTFFAFFLETEFSRRLGVISVALIFGFILPIVMFMFFYKRGKVIDLDASEKNERTIPYIIGTGFYSIGLISLLILKAHPVIIAFWFCYISNTIMVIFINKYWKISAHALGASGPLGAITFALGLNGLYFIIILVLIAWARLKLKCHTPAQIIAGALFGFCSTFLQMDIIVKLLN